MKKYRVCYDRVFNAWPPFKYKDYIVMGVSLDLMFKFFKDDKEILFNNGEECYFTDNILCSVDKEKGFVLISKPVKKENWFDELTCEVDKFYIDIYEGKTSEVFKDAPKEMADFPVSKSISVPKEEFLEVIKSHWDNFNNKDNFCAQNCSVSWIEANKKEKTCT